jgi:adenylylsulfate kinase-like enzyme|tara:strand:+ start:923 stop:1489 length:567 start_codon:yes stop_codon:yes gene_type:complete
MKKRKIVIIRGKTTGGKSTISYELAKVLPGWIFIDGWKIKEMFDSLYLKDEQTTRVKSSKKAVISIMKEVMRAEGINIILQESTQSALRKSLRKDLKKYNYEIYSIFLEVELKDAIKRDIKREKPTMRVNKRNLPSHEWKKMGNQPKKEDFIINTSHKNKKEVINSILKHIKEKRKKHPKAHLIKRSW